MLHIVTYKTHVCYFHKTITKNMKTLANSHEGFNDYLHMCNILLANMLRAITIFPTSGKWFFICNKSSLTRFANYSVN